MSPGPRPSGPTGLPSAPEGPEPPPPGNLPHQGPPLPGSPEAGPPRTRVHRDRPPAGTALPLVGTPHHLDDPVHPRSRIGIGPEHQLLPEKPVAGQRNPDPGRPAGTTPGHRRLRDRYVHLTAVAVETDLDLQARELDARQTALQDNTGTPPEQVIRADPVLKQSRAGTRSRLQAGQAGGQARAGDLPGETPGAPGMDKLRKTRKTGAAAGPQPVRPGNKQPTETSPGETQWER